MLIDHDLFKNCFLGFHDIYLLMLFILNNFDSLTLTAAIILMVKSQPEIKRHG